MAMTAAELLAAAHRLPFRSLHESLENRPFVVIAPHPDDESLACGGLITQACRQGFQVKIVVVSDGAGSHPNSRAYPPLRLRALREGEARRAGKELGVAPEDMLFLALPDRFVVPEGVEADYAIDKIVGGVKELGARSLFVSWRHDPHCDHQASYRIAREVQHRVPPLRLFEYIVWGHRLPPSTKVGPIHGGFRIRLDHETLETKRHAIAAHRSQTTDLIDDDPEGFRLSQSDLVHFDLPYEFFVEGDA
jgi:LmbE family N-acetylglucosaminyl deacetylase